VTRDLLCSLMQVVGTVGVLVASFAADWRAGVAVTGVGLVAGGWVLDNEQEEQR
jgi:hypothetical protein